MSEVRINLGSGRTVEAGWVNADIRKAPGVTVRLDAEKPLPFRTASVDLLRAHGLLEHLWHWEDLMIEAARVLKPRGRFEIKVPYRIDYAAYHVRYFDKRTFDPYRSDSVQPSSDMIPRRLVFGSLEFREPYFTLAEMWIEHRIPFAWHFRQYLGINAAKLPLGKRLNLFVTLSRNEAPWNDGRPTMVSAARRRG